MGWPWASQLLRAARLQLPVALSAASGTAGGCGWDAAVVWAMDPAQVLRKAVSPRAWLPGPSPQRFL